MGHDHFNWTGIPVSAQINHLTVLGMANASISTGQLANVNTHPLVKQKMSELRDKKTDSKRFRELVREIGALLGYEATKDLQISEIPDVCFAVFFIINV